ncbi:MAG TPA: toprim domain-containing protein, partial [Ilumatobacteraceae bacterium]|nr:toprim domain-containing protein [Ilumatobacteraceae bacterium]
CWSGGHGGTAIDALLVARGGTIADALVELEHRAGSAPEISRSRPLPRQTPTPVETRAEPDAALLDYVAACERILWHPAGRKVLDYLVTERGLAPDALKANHVGADPGPSVLRRAAGLPRGGAAAVLPALDLDGKVRYAQARYLEPVDGRPKYDNPAGRLAANPRLGWVHPATLSDRRHLVVCEGAFDALTVAGTGTPAVAVLGATYVDERVARDVVRGAAGRQVMLAFDGDPAGRIAGATLAVSLTSAGCPNGVLPLPDGCDVNTMLRRDCNWITRQLEPTPTRHGVGQHDLARTLR